MPWCAGLRSHIALYFGCQLLHFLLERSSLRYCWWDSGTNAAGGSIIETLSGLRMTLWNLGTLWKTCFFPMMADTAKAVPWRLALAGPKDPKDPKARPCKSSTSIASARASKGSDVIFSELAVILPRFHVRFYDVLRVSWIRHPQPKQTPRWAEKGPKRKPMYLGNGDCCTHLGLKWNTAKHQRPHVLP